VHTTQGLKYSSQWGCPRHQLLHHRMELHIKSCIVCNLMCSCVHSNKIVREISSLDQTFHHELIDDTTFKVIVSCCCKMHTNVVLDNCSFKSFVSVLTGFCYCWDIHKFELEHLMFCMNVIWAVSLLVTVTQNSEESFLAFEFPPETLFGSCQ
jgi:hypothetical protein